MQDEDREGSDSTGRTSKDGNVVVDEGREGAAACTVTASWSPGQRAPSWLAARVEAMAAPENDQMPRHSRG